MLVEDGDGFDEERCTGEDVDDEYLDDDRLGKEIVCDEAVDEETVPYEVGGAYVDGT